MKTLSNTGKKLLKKENLNFSPISYSNLLDGIYLLYKFGPKIQNCVFKLSFAICKHSQNTLWLIYKIE